MSQPRHRALLSQLSQGIADLTSSEQWRRYLFFQSRFHHYSYGNVLLIAAQREGATRVAGFAAWRRCDRTVRRGEHAIWILAPMRPRRQDEDSDGVVHAFKFVPVFDVAQTEGAPLPEICARLEGADPAGHYQRLVAVADSLGFTVRDHGFADGVNGDCSHERRRIRVETANPPAQRVKTLAHELAHAVLHHQWCDRRLAELEAESTAYVVCRSLGLETGSYSFGYVATWAGGGEPAIAGIKASCGRIQQAAASILTRVVPPRLTP
jgi:antirestriction protein ArdC